METAWLITEVSKGIGWKRMGEKWGGLGGESYSIKSKKSPESQQEVVLVSQIPVFFSVLYTLI